MTVVASRGRIDPVDVLVVLEGDIEPRELRVADEDMIVLEGRAVPDWLT